MNKRKLAFAALDLILLGAGYGFYHHHQQQEKPLTLYGNIDTRTVNLAFRVGGRVAELNVDEGDAVQAGQPLATLDAAPYLNAQNLASAQAQLQLAQEGYRQEEIAQVRSQVVQSQAAYDYANSFYQRQQGLWDKRAISANMLDDARTTRNQALATLQAAKDKLSQFESGNRPQEIAAAQAAVAQAEAGLAQAELNKQDTELLAPSPGVILTRAAEKGSMLASGSTVFTLSLTRPVWVRAYVSEKDLGRVVPGSQMLVYTDGRPNQPYRGKVGFVSPSAEFTPKSVETEDLRTDLVYRLRIVVTDPDDGLRQGMPVTLRFEDAHTGDANRANEPVRHD
ncbi:secretion protein HlyD [Pectobacterium versatile]|uniref:secretion protein HlyD n=1 Tax=Pectobacterium versatile TaxID=2488639 RepID=UPI000DAB37B7|nr:secretion protein HlyD [Pectobacterium versatile]GBO48561.1 multidrug resistance protein MdtN [Pectobacterium versatile]